MKQRKKMNIALILLLIVLFLGLGYAYLTTTLSINGITDVNSNSWNVYWDNAQVLSSSITEEQVLAAPTIDTNKTTVSFHLNLKQPGDYYEFTVDAVNSGTIDAMVEIITKTVNDSVTIPAYLNYTVTYSDDISITQNHLLASNTTETYKIKVEYRDDINASDLPSTAQSLDIDFAVEYVQADSNAFERPYYIYTVSKTEFVIGSEIPTEETVVTYTNYQDAIAALGQPMFFRHEVLNNVVQSSYVGFVIDNQVYYLRAGGATYDESTESYNDDSIYYEDNKNLLTSVFGIGNCVEYQNMYGSQSSWYCYQQGFRASAHSTGAVAAYQSGYNVQTFDNVSYMWCERWASGCSDKY